MIVGRYKKLCRSVLLSVILLSAGCASPNNDTAGVTEEPCNAAVMTVDWDDIKDNFRDIYGKAELIISGHSESIDYFAIQDMPFTSVKVKVDSTLKGKVDSDTVDVIYTGGWLGDTLYECGDLAIPEGGKEYMFALVPFDKENGTGYEYEPVTGFQGTYLLDSSPKATQNKTNSAAIVELNPRNAVEKEIINKTLDEIIAEYK